MAGIRSASEANIAGTCITIPATSLPAASFTFGRPVHGQPDYAGGGNSAADLLMGTISRTDLAIGLAAGDFKANSLAFFLDDTWKVTRN